MKRAQVRPLILRGPRFPSNPSNLPPRRGVERSPFTLQPPSSPSSSARDPVSLRRGLGPALLVLRAILRADAEPASAPRARGSQLFGSFTVGRQVRCEFAAARSVASRQGCEPLETQRILLSRDAARFDIMPAAPPLRNPLRERSTARRLLRRWENHSPAFSADRFSLEISQQAPKCVIKSRTSTL